MYSTTAVVSDKRQSYFVISIPKNLLIQNVTSPKSKEYDKFSGILSKLIEGHNGVMAFTANG